MPFLQYLHVEVDQQADGASGQAQVREHLDLVDRRQRLDGLQFEDDAPVY
jgi:hypothetical protein